VSPTPFPHYRIESLATSLVAALALALSGWSCAGSSFSGDSAKAPEPAADEDEQVDTDNETDDETDQELGTTSTDTSAVATQTAVDQGFNVAECKTPTAIADAAGTFAFNSEGEVRDYVNSLSRFPQIPTQFLGAGGIRTDVASRDVVCKLKGYDHSTGFSSKSYSSCHDNYIVWWEPTQNTFSSHNACDANNRIATLTCAGKLRDECVNDPAWVFKP
jgi:hypothetical protein